MKLSVGEVVDRGPPLVQHLDPVGTDVAPGDVHPGGNCLLGQRQAYVAQPEYDHLHDLTGMFGTTPPVASAGTVFVEHMSFAFIHWTMIGSDSAAGVDTVALRPS